MIIRRLQSSLKAELFKKKAIIILGPRQVGKTTLAKTLLEEVTRSYIWLNADEPDVREALSGITSTAIRAMVGDKEILVIDEAQRIVNIGLTLKLITDNLQKIQVIVTGSSALDLRSKINEPLTGRKFEHFLFPFSFMEMATYHTLIEEKRLLTHRLVYGYYPEVVLNEGKEQAVLRSLTDSSLYKDLFSLEGIQKPILLENLLRALALQVGTEVSLIELSQTLRADYKTVEKYMDLLEQAFIIFQLPALSRNLRNEIKKGRKVYFYDNGILNAFRGNFSVLSKRTDVGPLFENFMVSERRKILSYNQVFAYTYFWRTTQQQEIDYIEDYDGIMHAYEFKWSKSIHHFAKTFKEAYPDSEYTVINQTNFDMILL